MSGELCGRGCGYCGRCDLEPEEQIDTELDPDYDPYDPDNDRFDLDELDARAEDAEMNRQFLVGAA